MHGDFPAGAGPIIMAGVFALIALVVGIWPRRKEETPKE